MKRLQLLTALLLVAWLAQAAAAAAAAAADSGSALFGGSSSSNARRMLQELDDNCNSSGAASVVSSTRVTARSGTADIASETELPITYDWQAIRGIHRQVPKGRRQGLYAARVQAGSGSISTSSLQEPHSAAAGSSRTDSSGNGSSAEGGSVIAAGLVKAQSVCRLDPAFNQTTVSRNTCRLFVNAKDGAQYMCTAWFITPRHVVSAGHCVSSASGEYYLNQGNPGSLCCRFAYQRSTGNTTCSRAGTWRLLRWVTTKGHLAHECLGNDGPVFEVEPVFPDKALKPQVQRLAPFYPGKVGNHVTFMDGYPGPTTFDRGCQKLNITDRYATQAQVRPLSDGMGDGMGEGGKPVEYAVAGCVGESGGRVLRNGASGAAYGIQTYGNTTCERGRGMTGVTQISTEESVCGVCISCLLAALQKEAGTLSPSPSPQPSP